MSSQDDSTSTDKDNKTAIDDVSQLDTQVVSLSPFYQAIEQFFEALTFVDGLSELSGRQAWQTLFGDVESTDIDDIEITLEDWLLGLVNHFYTHQSIFEPKLDLSFEERALAHYTGNHIVTDIIISHANVVTSLDSDLL